MSDSPVYRSLLDGIVEYGEDPTPRLILADWLDEHNRSEEAELMRLHVALLATCCDPNNHPERVRQQSRIVELLTAGVYPCVPQETIALAEGVDMTFAWIPPGTFLMGSPAEEPERIDNESLHKVALAQSFYLGIHTVTQAQWQAVMGNNPSHFKRRKRQDKNSPVQRASWDDCQAFCTKLSQREGKRYGLPSESEWEYACRAGTATPFFFGDTLSTDQANHNGNYPYNQGARREYRLKATSVGSFPPNAWGLFDMHGNVWEWCQDEYKEYKDLDTKNSLEIGNIVENARVLRGGSWNFVAWLCRAAVRYWHAPDYRDDDYGFRVVFRLD